MYIITVVFEIKPEFTQEWRSAIQIQAENSLKLEADCHQFDVCYDEENENLCFLYEKYTDRAAFDQHVASDHYAEFSKKVGPMIKSKEVEPWIQ